MFITLMDGIATASGTLCKNKNGSRIIVTTRKAPSTNPKRVRMYIRSNESYERKTPLSEKEIKARELFIERQALVKQLIDSGQAHSKAEAWKIAKEKIKS